MVDSSFFTEASKQVTQVLRVVRVPLAVEPQAIRAVALAKALAWERERRVDEAIVEYPRYGVVRRVRLTTRKKAAYRRTIRTVRELDALPPRLEDTSKCASCRFAEECGVKTGTLRSRLAGD